IHASAGQVAISEDKIEIKDLSLVGAGGDLKGSILITPRVVTLDARGQGVDLDLLSRFLGLPRGKLGGKLDIDADVAVAEDVERGHVQLKLEHGSIADVAGLDMALEATLGEHHVAGSSRIELAGIARGTSQFDVALPGSAADVKSWRKATGRLEFRLDSAELSPLVHVLPESARIERIDGKLAGQVIITRESAEELPSVTVLAATSGLVVVRKAEQPGKASLEIAGIEVQLGSHVEGPSGEVDATLRLLDGEGSLATASGRTHLPLEELVHHPEKAWQELSHATLLGKVVVEERSLETLPDPLRPKGMHGVLRAEATLGGSLKNPLLTAKGSLAKFTVGRSREVVPVDLCVQFNYSHESSELTADGQAYLSGAQTCSGDRVGLLRASGKLDLGAPAESAGPPHVFTGEAGLSLEGLPLEAITPLGASGVRGKARGMIVLEQGDGLPQLNAVLDLDDVKVETVSVGRGRLNVRSDGKALRALASFEQDQGAGHLQSELSAALTWDGVLPTLDHKSPLLLEAHAEKVDAVLLLPALGDVFSDLSGPIDGRLKMQLEPDAEGEHWQGEVSGVAEMHGGSMQFNGLGMRLSDVAFTARTRTEAGRTVIEVRDLTAASRARSPNIAASGDVYLEHLGFVRARANVNLKDVPILIQGVSQANATGRAFFDVEKGEDKMTVRVSLPELKAELPPSSGREVLSTDNNRAIDVVQPLAEPRKRKHKNEEPLPWQLVFELGDNVKVVRSDLSVPISSKPCGAHPTKESDCPMVSLAEEATVSGTVVLNPGGRVQLLGKTFVIENGEISFDTDDPSNPHVRILASWRAPEGTVVYLKISGTYREAKLDPSSDPPLSDQEIYALLLGGSSSKESGSATATGVGLGAGVLGKLLSDTPLRNVELRTASEQTVDERTYSTYTAAVQISDEIWFEGSYKALNDNEPAQENQAVSGTVDWRFRKDWSLRTEVGTIGAGLDLLWTYHY
ncbi:MAG TPA: translocation/assembly module TamB domain-containing protein, partial [Polyangiaceae bacterium]|nr:translocation/assembly module TamB domain-containing protein [Polyangiaceae bacterium]